MLAFCLNCGNEKVKSCRFCIRCGSELTDVKPLQIYEPGTVLDKRYKIELLLRETDLGMVYKALDTRFKTLCVIKELLLNYDMEDLNTYIDNIRKEIKLFCNTRHPCVPVITNFFVEKGRHYLSMDYFEGKTPEVLLKEKGDPGLPQNDVITWALQILDMLDYIHGQDPPIIYRDIAPNNIMIKSSDKRLVFLDFYISSADPQATLRGVLPAGSFSAPEEKSGEFGVRSDIFSTGATMYYLLTGKLKKFSESGLKPVTMVLPDIHPVLGEVISQALQPKPENRYESALVMKQALLNISAEKQGMIETVKMTQKIEENLAKPTAIQPPSADGLPTQKISPAETAQMKEDIHHSFSGVSVPQRETPSFKEALPFQEKEKNFGELEKADRTAKSLNAILIGGGVVILVVIAAIIYWLATSTMSEKIFNDGILLFKDGQQNAMAYYNAQGKDTNAGYARPRENFSDAIIIFEKYLKVKKDDPRGHYIIGHCYYSLYNIDRWKSLFEEVPLSSEANLDQSIESFKKAIYLDPLFPEAHYYLGKCYFNKGDMIKAREELEKTREVTGKLPDSESARKSSMENKINAAVTGFISPVTVPDTGLTGSRIVLKNGTSSNFDVTINNEYFYVTEKEAISQDFPPGEYKIEIKVDSVSYTDKLVMEDKNIYTLNLIKELSDKFTDFDLDEFKNKKKS